ncbi:MAG: RNA methyltransferase [Clostridia bacterium]|nr:RNA methyltransferase [Clostridia bacterium]
MEVLFQTITSKSNPKMIRVGKYVDKKYRDADGVFVCEGIKLFEESVLAGASVREVYVSDAAFGFWGDKLNKLLARCPSAETYRIPNELYKKISTENAPQGILAVVDKLANVHRCTTLEQPDAAEKMMLFESVRDPGNLGTLIRTAAAFGFNRLVLSADCADVFNPKVLRGAMGAIFKIRLDYCESFVSAIHALNQSGRRTMAALPRERALVAGKDALRISDCIVIGNEGHGLSPETVDACSDAIYIPMEENTESLNAAIASSVLMWEIAKIK